MFAAAEAQYRIAAQSINAAYLILKLWQRWEKNISYSLIYGLKTAPPTLSFVGSFIRLLCNLTLKPKDLCIHPGSSDIISFLFF